MAAKLLELAIIILSASLSNGSRFAPFAATYHAHAINHAVAYPASGSKVPTPTAPAVAPASIPTAVVIPAVAPVPSAAPTTAASPTPGTVTTSSKPLNDQSHLSPIAFATPPFGFVVPRHLGLPAASTVFGPSPVYFNSHFFAAPYANPAGYRPAASVPAFAPASIASASATPAPSLGPAWAVVTAPVPAAAQASPAFAVPSYLPW